MILLLLRIGEDALNILETRFDLQKHRKILWVGDVIGRLLMMECGVGHSLVLLVAR